MIGIITTLATVVQPEFSMVELVPTTQYIINSENITRLDVYGTADSLLSYSWNSDDDQMAVQKLFVTETNAQVVALSDVVANSNMLSLPVFAGIISFSETVGETAVDQVFNIADIVFVEEDASATLARLLAVTGGFEVREYIIDNNLAQIMDLATTGTTTTTTSTTTGG